MRKNGIDVSVWNGDINFNEIKSDGIDFVIIRAGYGKNPNQKDKYFESNYKKARNSKLDIGVYWYSYANSIEDARKEARTCIDTIKDKKFEYPIYFDIEEKSQFDKGIDFCDNIISTFCNELEREKYFAGFYISYYYLNNFVSKKTAQRYALWIADYSEKPKYDVNYGLWQYSSKGIVNGIKSNCDMNYSYIDYPSIIINGNFNGYNKNKDVNKIVDEVIKGLWGNGEERERRLTEAGYDYKEIQDLVNKKLSK